MSCFDEEPDGDPHGECAAEIDKLKALNAELSKALEAVTDEATEIAELLALMGRLPASTGRDNAAIVGARAALAKQKESS